jgi:Pyruvate/2-oxoacid:ferredoxin oxidoreductase delta subunit
MDAHEQLRKKLDLFPIGLPKSDETDRMLKLLFSDHDARLAMHVPNPPLLFSAERIAARAGVEARAAARGLLSLAERGLIGEITVLGRRRNTLFPAVPGFMEFQFMLGQDIDEKRAEAGRLWHKALDGPFGEENYGPPTSGVRVIPLRKTVKSSNRTFAYEEAEKLLHASGSIAVTECACRKSAQKCHAPLEVCFMLNTSADYLADRGLARKIGMREARAKLELAADAGLVHTVSNTRAPVQILCNCCSCCCASLRGVTGLGKPVDSIRSNFVCAVLPESDCKSCGACAKACPVHALRVDEEHGVIVNAEACLGCGVCVNQCPTGSLELRRTSRTAPPLNSLELLARMVSERGKAPRMIRGILNDLL